MPRPRPPFPAQSGVWGKPTIINNVETMANVPPIILNGGKWYAAIENGELTISEGEHDSPSLTITMADQDYIDMSTGKLNGQVAFMTGKLKIKGDMGLALKMQQIFKR